MPNLVDIIFGSLGVLSGFAAAGLAGEMRFMKRVDYTEDVARAAKDREEMRIEIANLSSKIDEQAPLLYKIAGKLGVNGVGNSH